MDDIMIKIDDVSKVYKLGQIGGRTLRDVLQSKRAKMLGKEDPNKLIGAKDYNKGELFKALDSVSFDVKKGERVGIIGHNGAGKSTLLKLLSRVTAPTSGAIGLNGRVASMLEVGTGFHPELTGRENIYMNGAILGMTKSEIDRKMDEIIDFSECRQFIDTPVKRYSSGMYVKLAFSVAAHLDSEIMIMDEVLAVGDAAFQEKCLDKMSSVSQNDKRTILYVSHNMNTIRQLCNRCVVLDHGKMIYDGDVDTAIALYYGRNAQLRSFYDLSTVARPIEQCKKVKIDSIEFVNKDLPVYESQEKLRLGIQWRSFSDDADVSLRIVICGKNHAPVGMAEINKFRQIQNESNYSDVFSLDISSMPEGDYLFFIVLYEKVSNGDNVVLDGPSIYIPFKFENYSPDGLRWDHSCWGNIRFPKIELE